MPPGHKPKPQRPANHQGPMKVICLGLPRCATSTLKLIIEDILDIGACMHMSRCLPAPPKMKLVEDALLEKNPKARRAILFKLFDGCAATADFPGHLFVEDLMVMYPDAKFVLNVRSGPKDKAAASWAASMQEAIGGFYTTKYRVACWWSPADWQHYRAQVAWQDFVQRQLGVEGFCDEELYERHNAWVRGSATKAGVDLLEWEPGMGYEPLCGFLGEKVPKGNEVPKTNERGQMKKVLAWRMSIGMGLWAKKVVLPSVVVGGSAILYTVLGGAPALGQGFQKLVS